MLGVVVTAAAVAVVVAVAAVVVVMIIVKVWGFRDNVWLSLVAHLETRSWRHKMPGCSPCPSCSVTLIISKPCNNRSSLASKKLL